MQFARWIRTLVVFAVVAGLGVAVWQYWATRPTAAAPNQVGWISTKWGPLGPGDRDSVVKVRLAGLWEHPVGQEAADRAATPRVREIAGNISREHLELDRITIDVARELGIQLPNQPSVQQQQWMTEISAQAGTAYDTRMVNLLRQAHGNVLPLLTQIRTTTRNEKIRVFTEQAITFVTRHINYLESTGLVNFDELPEPPEPARAVVTRSGTYENVPVALGALIVLALSALVAALILKLSNGRKKLPRPRARPPQARHVLGSNGAENPLDPRTDRDIDPVSNGDRNRTRVGSTRGRMHG